MAGFAKPPEHEINPAYQHPAHGSKFLGAGVPGSEIPLAVLKNEDKDCAYQFHLISFLHDFHFWYVG